MDDKHLQIPKDLRSCAPWTAAQNEIFAINAYKVLYTMQYLQYCTVLSTVRIFILI